MAAVNFKDRLLAGLGGEWPEPCDLKPRLREKIAGDGYRIESLYYDSEPGDAIPAYLMIPDGVDSKHPAPAVAIWHQHAGQYQFGKGEPAGLLGNPMHHTGAALAK